MPRFKFAVTHDSTETEYEIIHLKTKIKKRENNYDTLELTVEDPFHALYNSGDIAKFDIIKAYIKDATDASWTQIFGGTIRQTNPQLDSSSTGATLTLNCKGYGAALEETHCNRDMGFESSHYDYHDTWGILQNIINDFVEKSYADTATGHVIDSSYISTFCGTNIRYINNPYRANMEVIDTICQLTSAIGTGTAAGGHYIVDNTGRFLFGQIGDHTAGLFSPESYWPDWWDTDAAGSTLAQGIDFESYTILDKSEEYANNFSLITDFRRPSYDYWTNNAGIADGIWSTVECTATAVSSTPTHVVGDKCLKLSPTNPAAPGYAYFRFNATYSLDVTKIGSIKTIPRLNFYSYKPAGLDENNTSVRLYKTAYNSNYYECVFSTISQDDDVWAHKSIPIGPYWKSEDVKEKNEFNWTDSGGDWSSVAGIAFKVNALTYLGVDDLHITGKVIRQAKHSQAITANKEYQKVLIARNAMDDSCIAEDDTGFAARIALAELLRRIYMPKTIIFTTSTDMKTAMAGQKIHVHACKQVGGTFGIDADMRILELEFTLDDLTGYSATVTATTDLTNSFAINNADAYTAWQENMFVNSSEAKNIRSGAEVDLLIPPLIYDYGP